MHIHCHTVYIPSFLGREKVNERRERVGGGGWEGGLDKRMPKGGGGGGERAAKLSELSSLLNIGPCGGVDIYGDSAVVKQPRCAADACARACS